MASRTRQKEEARIRRLAEERAALERQRRQRRLQMLIGIVVASVAVVAVAIVIGSSGGSSGGLQQGTKLVATKSAVTRLLSGIPQVGSVLGKPTAPVTMIYYGDLECPVCKDFTLTGGFPELVAKDVRAGKVKVEYRAFETATQNPSTFQTQQVAALAAGKQNHFWDFAELFYRQQGQEGTNYVNEAYLDRLAAQIPGLSLSTWRSARSDSTLASQVTSEKQTGTSAGVTGTPTLVFQGPNGKATASEGVPDYSSLEKSIQSVA
jgi:protein-disulfide isomerase